MLITFKTKAYANITMLGEPAKKMLKMMDFGVTVPGGLMAQDVSKALENLQTALEAHVDEPDLPEQDADGKARVSLHTRALPLIALLNAATADNNNVRWE